MEWVIYHDFDDVNAEPVEINPPLVNENMDILNATTNKYGILHRPGYGGENKNDSIELKKAKENKKEYEPPKNKFIPGERLLMMIKDEKPELLESSKSKIEPDNKNKKVRLKRILKRLN